jgi:L-iditol 2-dehydrogenase
MTAAFLYDKEDLRLEYTEKPLIGEGELRVKLKAAFVCGTDVRMFRNGHKYATPDSPLIIGHEISGVIEETGNNVKHYKPGMRVAIGPNMGCGVCDLCISGNTHLCQDYRALGIHLPGGFADYVLIPEIAIQQGNVFEISEDLSFEEAALFEPLSCVYNAFERSQIQPGDSVLIIGAGPIGIMHAQLASLAGAQQVMMNDINMDRLQIAVKIVPNLIAIDSQNLKENVIDRTQGKGLNVTITACPATEAQQIAIEIAAINGRVIFFGGLPADKANVPLNTNLIHYKQIWVTGTTRASLIQIRKTLNLLENNKISVKHLISSRQNLENIHLAFERAVQGDGLKHAIISEDKY